jgi:ABC-type uncharacterized transport system auxiliary subunit
VKRLLALMAAALGGGCTSGLHSSAPPVQAYVLRAAPPAAAPSSPSLISVRIPRPVSAPGLDSDRIVILRPDRQMGFYAASRWAAALPDVVEALAVQTLRGSGLYGMVEDSHGAFPTDYLLQITIRRFEADYSEQAGAPIIHVTLDCLLGRQTSRELIASFVAESTQSVGTNRMASVVAGFEQAADAALATAAERTSAAIKTSTVRPPP